MASGSKIKKTVKSNLSKKTTRAARRNPQRRV